MPPNVMPEQLGEVIRYKHYSLTTGPADVYRAGVVCAGGAGAGRCGLRATWTKPMPGFS